jgi:hypothetical protein
MKQVDRTMDVQVEDLEVVFLEGKPRDANYRLAEVFHQNERSWSTGSPRPATRSPR